MVDGGLSIGFHTKELSPEEKALAMMHQGQAGWLVFAENEVPKAEMPKGDADLRQKTPSQRMRNVIYILWQQSATDIPFPQFYEEYMEKLIVQVKEALT